MATDTLPSAVTKLDEWKNRDTVEILADLLKRAKNGEVRGLLYSVVMDVNRHAMGVSGGYATDPMMAAAVTSRMQHKLHRMVDETE